MTLPALIPFDPAAEARSFRNALGQFATGVCVVTARTQEGQAVGITANSFASVSLDPPLVLWSPAKSARRHDIFTAAPHFAIHVLGHANAAIGTGFVREANAFQGLDQADNAEGVPCFSNCIARFECAREALHDAGDHTIILGRVLRACQADGAGGAEPLLFQGGRYGRFTAM